MSIKPKMDERVIKGQDELDKPVVNKSEVKKILSKCLKEKRISGEVLTINPVSEKIDYEQISKKYGTNGEGHIIWVQFASSGHVAVVGAGKDIGFPKNENKGTWSILSKISSVEWDRSEVIIIPVRELDKDSYGLKNIHKHGNNILKCRNGVEHCIGEYLIKKDVPILNYYQHRNYSERFWQKYEEGNYVKK